MCTLLRQLQGVCCILLHNEIAGCKGGWPGQGRELLAWAPCHSCLCPATEAVEHPACSGVFNDTLEATALAMLCGGCAHMHNFGLVGVAGASTLPRACGGAKSPVPVNMTQIRCCTVSCMLGACKCSLFVRVSVPSWLPILCSFNRT